MNDLTVLICSDYLPPSDGGVEKVVDELSRGLADRGVSVHLFSLVNADESVIVDDRIRVHTVNTFDFRKFIGVQSKLSASAIPKLYQTLKSLEPDVLHLHNRFFYTTVIGYLTARAARYDGRVVTTVHLGSVEGIGGVAGSAAGIYERTAGRVVLQGSDEVVAVSDAAAEHAASLGADPSTLHTVPNGVDPEEFRPPESRTQDESILFVGRLVRNKGPQDFIDALPGVFDYHDGVSADVVGTGPMRDELETKAAKLGIDDRVTFRGRVDDVSETMRESDIFCRPSHSEGLPLTLLEAMATGLPAVVTPIAGVPEVVTDRDNGMLVPTSDPGRLTETLLELVDDSSLRQEIGASARRYVLENHAWDTRTEALLNVYRPSIEGSVRGH